MTKSKYEQEMMEVVHFIESGNLLMGDELPIGIVGTVIHHLDEIPGDEFYEQINEDALNWFAICQGGAAIVNHALERDHNLLKKSEVEHRSHYMKRLMDWMHGHLKPKYIKHYFDQDIPGDMINCLEARMAMGRSNEIYELIFSIYQSGGYPCGWNGYWPVSHLGKLPDDGHIIAFYPLECPWKGDRFPDDVPQWE